MELDDLLLKSDYDESMVLLFFCGFFYELTQLLDLGLHGLDL